ncbi:hypothetical protein MKX07_005178 [Trichoderma sp. CBMAI-0711]|nr:hypothetical protein MKX07_005178 [Trichoderma sp. CBMAI-0711]
MAQVPILAMLLMLWFAGRASADGGDDFANNLASDLGPIIALFGERVVMQFMSQAMGIADCILLAVAPIGAITVVVSAIRVAGPTWLKAFIGRARENLSAAEVELMSSTSKEVCELWNGLGVVRCPGSADIYQFICLLPKGSNLESLSKMQTDFMCKELQDVEGEGADKFLRKIGKMKLLSRPLLKLIVSPSLPQFRKGRSRTADPLEYPDLEPGIDQYGSSASTQVEVNKAGTDPGAREDPNQAEKKEVIIVVDTLDNSSPNLLLNCHDKVHRGEIYLGAAFGVILQVGALLYFGTITYRPSFKGQFFLKDGKKIVDYAFPCAAAGTVLLVLGLFICAWVVERSTTEICYKAPNHQMFVVWLQKDHTVNDQVFKPYAIYPAGEREYITKSRRRIEQPGQQAEVDKKTADAAASDNGNITTQRDNKGAQWLTWGLKLEQITSLGALMSLVGFISQFIGMRGLNWTASVVQLAPWAIVRNKLPDASEEVALNDKKAPEWRLEFSKLVWTIPTTYNGIDQEVFIMLERTEVKWHVAERDLEAVLSLWLYSTPPFTDDSDAKQHRTDNGQHRNLRLYGPTQFEEHLFRDLDWWMPEVGPVLLVLARNLEKVGFGTLSEIYFDLIMPLSLERKLGNIKDVIDEAIEQAQRYESSRQWEQLVNTCCSLLDLAQKFDLDKEASGPLAVAVCIEFLYRLRHEADLQRRECRSEEELMRHSKVLEEKFTSIEKSGGFAIFPRVKHSLEENCGGYATTFDMLIGDKPNAKERFPESFNIVDQHWELMRASDSWDTLYWTDKDLGKTDNFAFDVLLEAGAKVIVKDKDRLTPLHKAFKRLDIASKLIESGADVNATDAEGRTALLLAVENGRADVAELLIDKKAKVSIATKNGRTPLHMAVGSKEIAKLLLDSGAAINAVDIEGCTPLYLATMEGTAEVASLLIDRGADVAKAAKDGRTPLHMALSRGTNWLEIAKKLLKPDMEGPNPYVNVIAKDGATPLHVVAEVGPREAVDILLSHLKADLNLTDDFGQTALLIAIYNQNWDIAESLLEAGADVNADSRDGYTPLLGAVMGDHEHIVVKLLRRGADVHATDEDGYSSVHLAVSQKNSSILRQLLHAGADINAVVDSDTPLHIAVRHGRAEMVQVLLENGADTKPLNDLGFTALQYAVYRRDLEIVKEFVKHDKSSASDARKAALQTGEYGDTPLHTCCRWIRSWGDESRMCEILEELLSVAPDIDIIHTINDEGLTPLDLARSRVDENSDFVRLLMKRGAKPSDEKESEESLIFRTPVDAEQGVP